MVLAFRSFERILAVLALGLALPLCAARAQTPDDGFDPRWIDEIAGSVRQIALTEDMIDRLVASHDEMRAAAAKFGQTELPEHAPAAGTGSDLDAMPDDKRKALEAIAVKYGFKDLEEWSLVASSVAMSYTYALQIKRPDALEEAVRLNIAQAERDPTLSEEQRRKTIALYRELGVKLAKLQPPKENVELIVRMKEKVTPLMEAR
jgi:hypothetical protein